LVHASYINQNGYPMLYNYIKIAWKNILKSRGLSVISIFGLAIGILIASPIAGYLINKWLEDYAYRIHNSWWIFVLAGAVALFIAMITVNSRAIKAAMANPVASLRSE
jgi:putative ABC transport system permease protein